MEAILQKSGDIIMTQFKPIGRMSVSQAIIDQITELIDNGEIKPGDRLPSERQLCEQFQVGRSSVREAMITLENMGIVERKNKKTILTKDEKKMDTKVLNEISAAFSDIRDVIEARNLLESEIILLAVERATEQDIAELKKCIKDTDSIKEYTEIDSEFHLAIARATHNNVISSIYKMLVEFLFSTHNVYEAMETQNQEVVSDIICSSLESHHKVVEAIASGDRKQAKAALGQHLHSAEMQLFSRVNIPGSSKNE